MLKMKMIKSKYQDRLFNISKMCFLSEVNDNVKTFNVFH